MSQSWLKTQSLFSKLITEPPLVEKFLKRPSPRYIFTMIINTMKKTGFPKGLFTPEEEDLKYFSADINHRKAFLIKVIDITKIITKNNFEIDITNILKGVEEEKTNIFLQNFYLAAITKGNFEIIIKKYLDEKSQEKIQIIQKEGKNIKDKNKPNKIIKRFIVWIDSKVNNKENKKYKNIIEEKELFEQYNLNIFCFDNLEEAFNFILSFIDFKPLFIIISGSLYPYYYHKLKENIHIIKCLPICIISTSNKGKEMLLKRKKQFNLTEEVFDSINNPFYNLGGICSHFC